MAAALPRCNKRLKPQYRRPVPGRGSGALLQPAAILVGNGIAPVLAEPARRDTDADRRLPALVFIDVNQLYHVVDVFAPEAGGNDFRNALVLLDVALDDGMGRVMRRQTVVVSLVATQSRPGRTLDVSFGDDLESVVAIAQKRVKNFFGDFFQSRKPPRHIAVKRG